MDEEEIYSEKNDISEEERLPEAKAAERGLKDKVKSAIAVTVSAGILLSGMFSQSAAAPEERERGLPGSPPAIVEVVVPDTDDGDNGEVEEEEEEKKKRGGVRTRLISLFARIPKWSLPFIGAGVWLLVWLGTGALCGGWLASMPLWLSSVCRCLFGLALAAALVCAIAKAAFPHLKLKDIFSPPRLGLLLAGFIAVTLGSFLLTASGMHPWAAKLLGILGGCAATGLYLISMHKEEKKREAQEKRTDNS